MKISRIRIRNYRSIRDLEFSPTMLCALVGGNNTGKSNILRAINLVLGERWPSVRSIDDRDFHGYDTSKDISIAVWFDETRTVRGDIGAPVPYAGILFRTSRYQRRSGKHERGDLRSEMLCIDDQGDPVKVLKRPNPNAKPYPTNASVTTAIREALPSVFIDVDRNAAYHLSGSRWSILGRLLRDVSKSLQADTERFDKFRAKFDEARKELRTPEFEKLEAAVVTQLRAHTGLDDVSVILDDVDPLNLYKSFAVLFQDGRTAVPVDAERMGSGIQSAVVIALLQAYRELRRQNAVLLFEEPELFLHPHGRRHLFRLLCDLPNNGTQVVYTTHSQDLLDLTRLDSIALVKNESDHGTKAAAPDPAVLAADWKEQLKLARRFEGHANEILFAESVVLVEGNTERAAVELLAQRMSPPLDLDRLNCSVVQVGGKTSMPIMMRVVRALGIRSLAVTDTDSHRGSEGDGAANERLNARIVEASGGDVGNFVFDPYLEEAISMPGQAKNEKEIRFREYLDTLTEWSDVPTPLRELMAEVRLCAEGQ